MFFIVGITFFSDVPMICAFSVSRLHKNRPISGTNRPIYGISMPNICRSKDNNIINNKIDNLKRITAFHSSKKVIYSSKNDEHNENYENEGGSVFQKSGSEELFRTDFTEYQNKVHALKSIWERIDSLENIANHEERSVESGERSVWSYTAEEFQNEVEYPSIRVIKVRKTIYFSSFTIYFSFILYYYTILIYLKRFF